MHAILHSFAYPLKPLTQASISIQPIPILHTTHNNVLPYSGVSLLEFLPASIPPGVSLLEFLSTAIPSGCLTPGILLRRHSIRMSHIRNPSMPPFHPGVSHSELYPVDFPSSPDISHPKFCPIDGPPFSPSLEHFLEVPKIPFSINLASIFFSAGNFRIFHDFLK